MRTTARGHSSRIRRSVAIPRGGLPAARERFGVTGPLSGKRRLLGLFLGDAPMQDGSQPPSPEEILKQQGRGKIEYGGQNAAAQQQGQRPQGDSHDEECGPHDEAGHSRLLRLRTLHHGRPAPCFPRCRAGSDRIRTDYHFAILRKKWRVAKNVGASVRSESFRTRTLERSASRPVATGPSAWNQGCFGALPGRRSIRSRMETRRHDRLEGLAAFGTRPRTYLAESESLTALASFFAFFSR